MKGSAFLTASFFTLVCLAQAHAAGPEYMQFGDFGRCSDMRLAPDQRIEACSTALATAGMADAKQIGGILLNLAVVHLQKGDTAGSLPILDNAIKYQPNLWQAYAMRAEANAKLGHNELVVPDLDQAVAVAPRNPGPLERRGHYFMYYKQYDRALADYNAAIVLLPNNPYLLASRGEVEFDMGKNELAAADLRTALDLDTNHRLGPLVKGMVAAAEGDEQAQLAAYTEAIQAAPNDARGYYNRGATYADLKQTDLALADFSKAIALHPGFTLALQARGRILLGQHQTAAALADANAMVNADGADSRGYLLRADTYVDLKRYDEAIADADQGAKLDATSSQAYNDACWARVLAGKDFDVALEDCNKALSLSPNSANILDSRGLVEFKLGDMKAAMEDYNPAIAAHPLATSLFVRGVIEAKLHDQSAADKDFAAAKATTPAIAETMASYGVGP
ncbi:MAG TPA: tetratricopeptide repeat protein [Rhizomicrobium sp.]|jgi:tetratricopeptide (TPR) repeat protein